MTSLHLPMKGHDCVPNRTCAQVLPPSSPHYLPIGHGCVPSTCTASTCTRASSRTSRRTASSTLSHWSMKPDRQVYIPGDSAGGRGCGNWEGRERGVEGQDTRSEGIRTMTSVRGCRCLARRAAQRRLHLSPLPHDHPFMAPPFPHLLQTSSFGPAAPPRPRPPYRASPNTYLLRTSCCGRAAPGARQATRPA